MQEIRTSCIQDTEGNDMVSPSEVELTSGLTGQEAVKEKTMAPDPLEKYDVPPKEIDFVRLQEEQNPDLPRAGAYHCAHVPQISCIQAPCPPHRYRCMVKTLLQEMPQMVLPLINEAFHENYAMNAQIVSLNNEFYSLLL